MTREHHRRFYVEPDRWRDDRIAFGGRQAHQIGRVLRLRRGDRLRVFDGMGREAVAVIERAGRGAVEAQILSVREEAAPAVAVTLAQGVAKAPAMDLIVQKATELGVARIVPVVTEHALRSGGRPERWARISREAAEQSGRADLPAIEPPIALDAFLGAREPGGAAVALWEGERETGLGAQEGLRAVLRRLRPTPRLLLLVGPEGGLTEGEARTLSAHGFQLAGMGPRLLRAETAALVALGIVQYEFGLLGG